MAPMHSTKVHFTLAGSETPLTLDCTVREEGVVIRWEDPTRTAHEHLLRIESPRPGQGWVHHLGEVKPFYYYQDQETLHLWLAGRTYTLALADLRPQRGGHGPGGTSMGSGEIKAPMPGTVLQIKVKPGDSVEAHQPLIIMESMKMEMTLSAPHPGRVAHIGCTEGQLVEMGAVLAKLEASETAQEKSHDDPQLSAEAG